MKSILLTRGLMTLVDDSDFVAANAHKWYAQKRKRGLFHAARTVPRLDGSRATLYLHQFLMPGISQVDHKDGDGLNNQRHNLRPATNRQNGQNRKKFAPSTSSRFKGVSWHSGGNKWQANITLRGKLTYLGLFPSEIAAARAYDAAAQKYFGDFCNLNFPV